MELYLTQEELSALFGAIHEREMTELRAQLELLKSANERAERYVALKEER